MALHAQCIEEGITFEILAQDDASDLEQFEAHKSALKVSSLTWERNEKNLGRAGNRNLLASKAKYGLLLFIDGDSLVENDDFISIYLASSAHSISYGGTSYPLVKPSDDRYLLHWKYARKFEALPVNKRVAQPYNSFHSNNFLIQKAIYDLNPFDESITKYGYEDHLFAHHLKKQNVDIHHIENPVHHAGLETNADFLNKTKKAIENLAELYQLDRLKEGNLIKRYEQLKRIKQLRSISKILAWKRDSILENLLSDNPRMLNFQLFKLDLFIQKVKESGRKKVR